MPPLFFNHQHHQPQPRPLPGKSFYRPSQGLGVSPSLTTGLTVSSASLDLPPQANRDWQELPRGSRGGLRERGRGVPFGEPVAEQMVRGSFPERRLSFISAWDIPEKSQSLLHEETFS